MLFVVRKDMRKRAKAVDMVNKNREISDAIRDHVLDEDSDDGDAAA